MRSRVFPVFFLLAFAIRLYSQVPTGTVIIYAGKIDNPPAGWLPCDGREISVTQFPALYAVIGTVYGGDGVSRFRLPDLRARVPVGASAANNADRLSERPLAQKGGEEQHVLSVAEMPRHSHRQTLDDKTGAQAGHNQADGNGNGGGALSGVDNGDTRSQGGSLPHNNMQPFLVLNYLIKT